MSEANAFANPGLALLAGALLVALLPSRLRAAAALGAPLLALWLAWQLPLGSQAGVSFIGYQLVPVQVTGVGRLFATVFAVMAFAGALFALRVSPTAELSAALAYAGGAVGVTFAGDLFTLFAGWELMAVTATFVIWSRRTPTAEGAGLRYLLVHLFGGMLLLMGIVGRLAETGSLGFGGMRLDGLPEWLILAGFLVNAGAPPLSAWIADAYPEASPAGTVFLSAFTTKTAVYALIVAFQGAWVLIPMGLYMVFYGIVYALLENDMRRILAYSIVNQVGFMVTGIGIGSELAVNGAAAHAFAHILYKGLLLMSAGAVLYRTGRRKCTELGGLFRTMPATTLFGIVGALAISAFPLTSGFPAKSLINSGAAEAHLTLVWYLLTAASAGVFLHAGIKFPWFVFFQRDSGLRPAEAPPHMMAAMALLAAFCIGLGVWYQPLYALLPFAVDYDPYTAGHVVAQLQLLLFAGLAFFVLLPQMQRTRTITLDWDWLYRRLGPAVARRLAAALGAGMGAGREHLAQVGTGLLQGLDRHHGHRGVLARTWPAGSMVLWVAVLLMAYLVLYYV